MKHYTEAEIQNIYDQIANPRSPVEKPSDPPAPRLRSRTVYKAPGYPVDPLSEQKRLFDGGFASADKPREFVFNRALKENYN